MENLNKITSQRIRELKSTLPSLILEKQFEIQPKLKELYTERHRLLYLEDTRYHLSYLAESVAANELILFTEYLSWAKTFFSSLPIDENDLILNLILIRDTLGNYLEPEQESIVNSFMNAGIEKFKTQSTVQDSFIVESNPLNAIATAYLSSLINGNKKTAHELIINAVQNGTAIKDIYINVFQATQKETGRLWQLGKITVAQEHFITAATQLVMAQLYPYLFTSTNKEKKIIVACAAGELHEIGARMVADLFEMDGWNSYYFGANTPQSSLLKAVEMYKPNILAISATMTFNLNSVSELIGSVKSQSMTNNLKILVGGYPFNLADRLWQNMGADGFALDAVGAIKLASTLMN